MTDISQLTHDTFSEHTGSRFRVSLEGGEPVDLELVKVDSLPPRDPNPSDRIRSEPFALLFRGSANTELWQQIHKLDHDVLGQLEIFLVPVGPDENGEGMCFEAVFN